ncbi:MAG: alpha/beta fold hydrolase, partial [Candidatus Baltobacteraceae bacterium]
GAAAALNRRLRERSPMPINHLGGVRVRWNWRGYDIFATTTGEGPPLLLVHGIYAGASSFEFRELVPHLATHYRTVAFDLLGCGLSEMPALEYATELFVEQILAAIERFADGPVTLVGASLGAAFAIRAAARSPSNVARLVAISPTGLTTRLGSLNPTRSGAGALLGSPLVGEALYNAFASNALLRAYLRSNVYGDAARVTSRLLAHYRAVTHQAGARFVPAALLAGTLDCNVARDLPFVEAPTLVVWGAENLPSDLTARRHEYASLARDGRLVTIAGAGRMPQEEQPARLATAIAAFEDRGRPAGMRSAPPMASNLVPSVFLSYDVRGIYPDELSDELVEGIGRAFVPELGAKRIVVGRDMRPSGERLFAALARGATEAGADVVDIGLVSTDALYFAVGKYGFDGGVMITASHNPANYNGLKLTRDKAQALSLDSGLARIRDRVAAGDFPASDRRGTVTHQEILAEFATHCLGFVNPKAIKPFKIAIDAGNGMAGKTVPFVFDRLGCAVVPLFFELDGSFPNHPASPIEPENMIDLQRAVLENQCDLGVAFDGDADRMFIVDERGGLVGGDIVTALVGKNTLRRYPGAKILYNLICSRSVPETIERAGGIPVRSPVGHSLIKKIMRDENIVFGGEHSGHFYFRDNWFADSGMIALLQCLEVFSEAGTTVSRVIAPIDTRFRSGEINSRVADIPSKLAELEHHYIDARIDHLDGVTIQYPDWWMNVRPSNTEPLLRLNVEGDTRALMERHRDEAVELIRS